MGKKNSLAKIAAKQIAPPKSKPLPPQPWVEPSPSQIADAQAKVMSGFDEPIAYMNAESMPPADDLLPEDYEWAEDAAGTAPDPQPVNWKSDEWVAHHEKMALHSDLLDAEEALLKLPPGHDWWITDTKEALEKKIAWLQTKWAETYPDENPNPLAWAPGYDQVKARLHPLMSKPKKPFELHPDGPQSPSEMKALIDLLRGKGVADDTLADIESGALPMDRASRMKRAREMGLDTKTPFKRLDVPGRTDLTRNLGELGSPGRSQNLLYAAPTYRQADRGNQTGGNTKYDLMFPEGILGLHQGIVTPESVHEAMGSNSWYQGDPLAYLVNDAADTRTNLGKNIFRGTREGYHDKATGEWVEKFYEDPGPNLDDQYTEAIRTFDMADDNSPKAIRAANAERRRGFLEANKRWRNANMSSPGFAPETVDDMLAGDMTQGDMYDSLGKELSADASGSYGDDDQTRRDFLESMLDRDENTPVAGLAMRAQMERSSDPGGWPGLGEAQRNADTIDDALHFSKMDFGGAELLKNLGYTGSVVSDETGMSTVSFYPERIREKNISALDPRYWESPNIFQSLLAPVGVAGAAAAGLGQEKR